MTTFQELFASFNFRAGIDSIKKQIIPCCSSFSPLKIIFGFAYAILYSMFLLPIDFDRCSNSFYKHLGTYNGQN